MNVVSKENYKNMVEKKTPNSHIVRDSARAFVVGGGICAVGQGVQNYFVSLDFSKEESSLIVIIILIGVSALLTGLGLYSNIGKFSGAGTIVPITGFANSVVSPAIEFKKEGFILGLGAKMFVIAGPVIVYGTLTSFVVGLFHYFLK